jgi:hypothetical protein
MKQVPDLAHEGDPRTTPHFACTGVRVKVLSPADVAHLKGDLDTRALGAGRAPPWFE